MKRWLKDNYFLLLIYSAFIVSVGLYFRGFTKYRGVETWPSVPVEILSAGGEVITQSRISRGGYTTTAVDARFVEFRYTVEGRDYIGTNATPDGGGVPSSYGNRPLAAYYDSSSPDVAVLFPVPFRGTGYLVVSGFLGILVAAHLSFTFLLMRTR